MGEAYELAEKALNTEFPEIPKKSPPMASNKSKKPAETPNINKKPIF